MAPFFVNKIPWVVILGLKQRTTPEIRVRSTRRLGMPKSRVPGALGQTVWDGYNFPELLTAEPLITVELMTRTSATHLSDYRTSGQSQALSRASSFSTTSSGMAAIIGKS